MVHACGARMCRMHVVGARGGGPILFACPHHLPLLRCVCARWLRENKHLRYMWVPDTDTVVVVQCNPISDKGAAAVAAEPAAAPVGSTAAGGSGQGFTQAERLQPLRRETRRCAVARRRICRDVS